MSTKDTTVPETMRSVTCRGIRDYPHHGDTLVPMPGPGEVLLRVEHAGICAGDAKCFAGAPLFWGDSTRPAYVQAPVTPGHEFAGHIAAVGAGVTAYAVGNRVTAEQVVACGTCLYCRKGLRWLCAPHDIYGFHSCVPGAMAEYMILPSKSLLHRVPSSLTPKEAVYIEPLSCGVHAVERGNPQPGDTVVVSGCGPIGLGILSVARAASPGRLIALDCSEERLALARTCGADTVLNVATLGADAAVAAVRALTDGGYGTDVYIEASGAGASVQQGLRMVRKAATFVEFSVFAKPVTVDWSVIGDTLELDLRGAHCSGDGGYARAVEMLAGGGVPAEVIVSHELPLDEVVRGIDLVNGGGGTEASCKVALDPALRG
ncbi:hypothetical protein BU14_0284s0003 [Porphyra umbilicalis]|uniref:Enoyl reductase (ER) domain-containing protein n=1 Tax=Porphyra umbilicalis TaxID=2786 RepID=A0A1X6P101_PORUM|nr:hypothetical protein BU14_0284s0003 [Porphyra umbilicalis]OSX74550.1 hypothetical protein BU14_0284s0003 [Porphyra umbilicalis]|eukprot:OSX74549.1 hypothetical protein BU14_0284s0003 [Porphyra umbilicalis]